MKGKCSLISLLVASNSPPKMQRMTSTSNQRQLSKLSLSACLLSSTEKKLTFPFHSNENLYLDSISHQSLLFFLFSFIPNYGGLAESNQKTIIDPPQNSFVILEPHNEKRRRKCF
jgi:hypothetical protein